MVYELIGTLLAGIVAAVVVWGLRRSLIPRLPGWLVPATAGAAMLAATITAEYGWHARTAAAMPEGMVVAQEVRESIFYRPWTYVAPLISRLVVVDRATIRIHPARPDRRLADVILHARWARPVRVPVIFDCAEGLRADAGPGVDLGPDGAVTGARWIPLDAGDPVLRAACGAV